MDTEPPYRRIAAEIRRRIDAGELSPGARVPSTRAITEEWGVAMATATKALAALRQEGLVRAVPGVGTVVTAPAAPAPPGRGPAGAGAGLSRDRVVRTAVALADSEGLPALSMRRVATELGLSTMALYRHVQGKGELVQLMADAVCAEQPLPARQPDDWRERFVCGARWMWAVYNRHPWMVHAMASLTRPTPVPNAMAYTEWMLRAGADTGLSKSRLMHLHLTLFAYIQGLAMATDLEAQALQDTGLSTDEWMARNETQFEVLAATGAYPHLNSLDEHGGFELDLTTLFEFGLHRILDGTAALISKVPE
ncbi:TetR/AcrR family transcriptional regulator C-terminal domain-containing protein [Streptomyces sp. NBC_01387]|uniref:TetR/AcrR family transcriptional regulator C-terminal domain-containing protein n=1 Tax=unclassified Streptomyces TaxID=2593676 RepID=UPI002025A1B4|nr:MULTISPECIES: TetR/AcrR family transcriptional regulator C-terminal domain-containing protein [unclassified Streptomyces]MCX4548078.1 TetR/AcrR family transcriptional regulator C-terminal domain-containing protein [Streptomyces sp. NBC_01500]WSC19742.1 TetR/AcrR family transcriptional regulator C-terminal domain-containing protein [Streptomyces sp. NBC_01766]